MFVGVDIIGDVTQDGVVGFVDFLVLAANFGRMDPDVRYCDGDLDGDGDVDFQDFLTLSANFGRDALEEGCDSKAP